MEEIKVNEYVRTISGNIDKVDALIGMIENTVHLEKHKWQDIKNIVKHSPNIIDLIEEGDYVNGSKVIEVDNCKGAMREVYIEGQNPDKDCGLYFEQIENIVTKEQFNQEKYEV